MTAHYCVMWSRLPPPVGGVTRSVEMLTNALRAQGVPVIMADLQRRRTLLGGLLQVPRRQAVHVVHVARLWRILLFWPLAVLTRGRVVLVLHSGSTGAQVAGMRPWQRVAITAAVHAFDHIWTTNDEIAAQLPPAYRVRARTVSPYSGHGEDRLTRGRRADRGLHLAVGSNQGLPEYNAEMALEVVELLQRMGIEATLHVLAYGDLSGSRATALRSRAAEGSAILWHDNLPSTEVDRLLSEVDVLLRPTRYDGDSILVRQALAAGTRVVASDVGPRPTGVELVAGEAEAWVEAIRSGGRVSDGAGLGQPIDKVLLQVLREAKESSHLEAASAPP